MKCNQSHPGLELLSSCPFPTTITIKPRAPPFRIYIVNKISKFPTDNLKVLKGDRTIYQDISSIGWNCRIRRLLLFRGINLTSVIDMILNHLIMRIYCGALENEEYPVVIITPSFTQW